jgi:hypothetical protein
VIYMGLATAPLIAEKLMADGLAPDMPVAVIENAARRNMRVLRGPLAGLPDAVVSANKVKSPALIIIGDVAGRGTGIANWLELEMAEVKILTGNDLKSGAVVWWDGQGWSRHVNDAVDVGEGHDAMIIAPRKAARRGQ